MKEIWKDIPEYEELYQISNLGRVRSKDRLIKPIYGRQYIMVRNVTVTIGNIRRNKNVTVKYRR